MTQDGGDRDPPRSDRLSRLRNEGQQALGAPRRRVGLAAARRFGRELQEDFRDAPFWHRALLFVTVALAGLFISMVWLALTDDTGSTPPAAVLSNPTATVEAGSVVAPEPTGAPVPTPVLGATPIPRPGESDEPEAGDPDPGPADDAGGQPPPPPPPPLPPPTAVPPAAPTAAPPPSGFGASQAIALTIGFYASAPGGHYTIDPSTCSATPLGGLWSVSCIGTLKGCTEPECVLGLNACIIETTEVVEPGAC